MNLVVICNNSVLYIKLFKLMHELNKGFYGAKVLRLDYFC